MNKVRFKYAFLLIFTFLFVNLLSINITKVNAEEETLDLSNAYRGEIRDYWALVNYGENYIGQDEVTIFLEPEAIENENVHYIQINEFDRYGDIQTKYFKRGIDSSFASRFTYTFVNQGYGKRSITIFLLENLSNKPTAIIERINIDNLERVRTIENLTKDDFSVTQEVTDMTMSPYKVFVQVKNNPEEYKLKDVRYSYIHKNKDGSEEVIRGSAIYDEDNHRYYFIVSENSTYNIEVEDHFGYIKETHPLVVTNFYASNLILVADYDTSLTRGNVVVRVNAYDAEGNVYPANKIVTLLVTDSVGNSTEIKNLGLFTASDNGVYTIYCKLVSDAGSLESTIQINIVNIDRVAPSAFVSGLIRINSSDVDIKKGMPYVFDPNAYILATDNASLGDNLTITSKYYYPSPADETCKIYQGNLLEHNLFEYLYGVNDACIEYEVFDEAGNSRIVFSRITVSDNTKPIVKANIQEIILQIGDDMPENDELKDLFDLEVEENSLLFTPDRLYTITGDFNDVDLENLGVYPVEIVVTDASGNVSDPITLTVVVTVRILVVDAIPKQYIVYGEPMIEILYTCNGNPCINHPEDSEILPADWNKLTGELYITSGAKYAGSYRIYSSLAINSEKYRIVLGTLGNFVIKPRTFKIIANSYSIDYKDEEPVLTWYMDTSVCNPDLSTRYTSFDEINYSCTFVDGDRFGGGSYIYDDSGEVVLHAGGIRREEGITVKYNHDRSINYYKIHIGDLNVIEASSGGKINYNLDFYGLYEGLLYQETYVDDEGDSYKAGARFYIIPKYVEVTLTNVSKIYGESDPITTYRDDSDEELFVNQKRADGKSNVQYEFTCFAYKEPIKSMTTSECQQETQIVIKREPGENVGSYKIIGDFTNKNYDVRFNEEFDFMPKEAAYLNILKRDIEMSVEGKDGSGKYTIFYEDALPHVTVRITSDPNLTYTGLASNAYLSINDSSIISFSDRLSYGDHPVKYLDVDGNVMNIIIGGFNEYIEGVGTYTIDRDTITILNLLDEDVLSNYNLTFNKGSLEVLARQIYIKIVEGLEKIYGDLDPSFTEAYIESNYGENTNYVVDGSGKYILQIINTLENTEIVDRDDYEPFDKDKLKYYLKRNNIRVGQSEIDIHDGEMVGKYLVSCDHFENATNYIIDIYQEYQFEITTREIELTIHDGVIEFNYDNIVPAFSYQYTNTVFGDVLIGQPSVSNFAGTYRNNGMYPVRRGEILAISSEPQITSVDDVWYINGESTNVSLDDIASLDTTLIKVVDGNYHIIDVENKTTIDTGISFKEVDVMWNYTFNDFAGSLTVIARNVIIVPEDDLSKQYGDDNMAYTYKVKHWPDNRVEAILDSSDFTGELDRESGEKPGRYNIVQNTLAPAEKGLGYNFNIMGFETNHYFTITKRILTIRHAASNLVYKNGEYVYEVEVFYGDSNLDSIARGYTTIEGSEAVNTDLCTMEIVNGSETCHPIYDKIVGSITTDPLNPEDVGEYIIKNKDLHMVRVINPEIDVSEYYQLTFIQATLRILPRIIYITPDEGQSKIYGEMSDEACEITYTYSPSLVKESDVFSGCLQREEKTYEDGSTTREDVGEYTISMGDLTVSPNYELVMNGSVKYQIRPRNITVTAKVMGDNIVKTTGLNVYTMTYGDTYELGYDIGGMGLATSLGDEIINNVELSPTYNGVGTYLVIQGRLVVSKPRNYNFTYINATFVVVKKTVHIKPIELSKIYGDADPEVFLFEFIGDSVPYTGELSRVSGENVGRYKIELGTIDFGENYDPIIDEAFFNIVARKVYVNAIATGKVYGDVDPEFEYTYTVEDNFILDVEFSGRLERENKDINSVGTYQILQNTLALNTNYEIIYTPAIFEIYYINITDIEIKLLSGDRYQIRYEEGPVRLYAAFNLGANPIYLNDVTWTITKTGGFNVSFTRDANNVIEFTPSGSAGVYLIKAAYNGISDEYTVVVSNNNVSDIYINLAPGSRSTQILGLEEPVTYTAIVHLLENTEEDLHIEWYVDDILVCDNLLEEDDTCTFTPSLDMGIGLGTHDVYAKINKVVSNELELVIKDNEIPKITLEKQNEIYYIEAHQNATANSRLYIEPGYSASDDVDGDLTRYVTIRGVEDIDYYKVGTYYVVYEVSDKHGHVANNFRTIIVQDTIAPIVKLNIPELSEYIIEYGDTYIEHGATAYDAYDAYYNKELTVYIDNSVNVNRVGVYEVVYFAVDSNGLRGQVTRIVRVQDTVKPTITLIGDEILYLEYKAVYKDPGAWFNDNYDGRYKIYPSTIMLRREGEEDRVEVSNVDTSILGTYTLTYYQEDSSGNPPEDVAVRTVVVRDKTPPVITLLGSNPYILRYGTEYVDPGYKVIDNYDGDITNNEELVTVTKVIGNTLGTYYVYYNAMDTHKNKSVEVIREVVVLDLVSPIIYFTDACPQYMYIEALTGVYDPKCNLPGDGYRVVDDYVPDIDVIQNWVVVEGEVDITRVGTYEITYNVSDRSGNKAVTLTRYVNVVDTTPPVLTLKPNEDGDINFYVEVFTQYNDPGYNVVDNYDAYHGLETTVDVSHNINLNKINTYTVTYIATDSNGNESEPVYREITVRDSVPPVVTLIGEAEYTIERGTKYAEYGATAKDNYDGMIATIEITGAPTGMERDKFEVQYCATDSSGNKGCATRIVIVEDTVAPVVLGVENNGYYRNPLYIYFSPLTGTDEILTGKLNGELINSDWYVTKEGIYHLEVTDDAGNRTVIDFTIDRTPPIILGAIDGEYINHDVVVKSDELLETITYKFNDGGFVTVSKQQALFEDEGQYWVYAMDKAGNVGSMISFIIDKTPPAYSLEGVLNRGITTNDVTLNTEKDVVVSVNNQYIPTNYTFTENGYYQVTIRDVAGNDVYLQFVINREPTVTIDKKSVTYIAQLNAIDKLTIPANPDYPKSSGFIFAKPLLEGGFEYVDSAMFSDEEYNKLLSGEDLTFNVPSVSEQEMIVAFVVPLDELNKFKTQTVEGDDDSAVLYTMIAIGAAALLGGTFYFFVVVKRKKEEEEEEEEIIEDQDIYY